MAKETLENKQSLLSMETKRGRILNTLFYPIVLVIIYVLCDIGLRMAGGGGFFGTPVLLTWRMFSTLIIQAVPNMYIAWGLVFIFSAGPDFSAAAILALAATGAAILAQQLGWGYPGLFLGGIGLFLLLQFLSTVVRLKFKLTAWVAGFAMMILYEGVGSFYTTYRSSINRPVETLAADVCRDLPKQPWPIILMIVGILASYLILNKTTLGIEFRAVGSNPQVASYMGIKSKKVAYLATLVGACFLGVAACYNISWSARITMTTGMGSMAFIGKGLSTFLISSAVSRKLSSPFAIALAAFFLSLFFFVLTRLGVPAGTWQEFIMGIFIVVFAALAFAGTKEVVK